MKKVLALATATFVAVSLTGCALLYPNWGTDQKPSDPAPPSASASASASETPSETATPSESPSAIPSLLEANLSFIEVNLDEAGENVLAVVEVTNIAQDGGKCLFVLGAGANARSIEVKAEPNVSTTRCFPVQLSFAGLTPSKLVLTVSYSSKTHTGSASTEIEVR